MYIDKKSKRRIPLKTLFLLISVLVVFVVLLTGVIMLLTKPRDIKDSLIKMPFNKDSAFLTVGKTIVYSDGDLLDCVDASNNPVWKVQLYKAGLNLDSNDYVIAVTGDNVIMALSPAGENLFATQINGMVKSVRLGKDKIAVYSEQTVNDKKLSYIVIFDLSGKSVYTIDVSGRYILDYGLDLKSGQLYVLELDASGAAPISRITTYRPETQSITGVKELEDQLVERVIYDDGFIYTLGTNRLSVYTTLNSQPKEMLVYGWIPEDISTAGNAKFVYVPSKNSAEIDVARVISMSGDETKLNLAPHVFKIICSGDKIYCFAPDSIFVYTGDGRFFRSYSLPFSIEGVKRAMDAYVFMSAPDGVYLLPLP